MKAEDMRKIARMAGRLIMMSHLNPANHITNWSLHTFDYLATDHGNYWHFSKN